ncbi:MAG: toll/interleukin-1 receptor domain-containing protein, partial [Anaerolineae bacterium]|nr:toll/interleukin-1 receptor domain-containing protein [Anaerolineae bacterium]
MADAFISYRRKPSAALAHLIQEKLQNRHHIDAYLDVTRTDGAHVQFPERLMTAIADAPTFICLLADSTLESEWVRKEIQQAYKLRKHCIPIFQESYVPPDHPDASIEYLLNFDGVQVLDLRSIFINEAIDDIAARVVRRPNRRLVFIGLMVATLLIGLAAAFALLQEGDSDSTPTRTAEIGLLPSETLTSTSEAGPQPSETTAPTSTTTIPEISPSNTLLTSTSEPTQRPSATTTPTRTPTRQPPATTTATQTPTQQPSATNTPTLTATPTPTTSSAASSLIDAGFVPITEENMSRVALGYAVPGSCNNLSPDGAFILTSKGMYDLKTGEQQFAPSGEYSFFSPDGRWLAVGEDGVYEVETGQKMF